MYWMSSSSWEVFSSSRSTSVVVDDSGERKGKHCRSAESFSHIFATRPTPAVHFSSIRFTRSEHVMTAMRPVIPKFSKISSKKIHAVAIFHVQHVRVLRSAKVCSLHASIAISSASLFMCGQTSSQGTKPVAVSSCHDDRRRNKYLSIWHFKLAIFEGCKKSIIAYTYIHVLSHGHPQHPFHPSSYKLYCRVSLPERGNRKFQRRTLRIPNSLLFKASFLL